MGREPELKTLESDENGSFLKALQGCVGGLIEPLPWLFDDAPAGYCNEEGALGATFLDANRAVYADKAMEDAGFLSQLDFRTPVREGDLYAIVFGDMVFTGLDPDTGEKPRHLTRGARARPRALRRRGVHRLGRKRASVPRPVRQAPPMKRSEWMTTFPRPPPGICPSLRGIHLGHRLPGTAPGRKGREKPSAERTRS